MTKHKWVKPVLFGVPVLIVVIIGAYIWKLIQSPRQGQVSNPSPTAAAQPKPAGFVPLDGKTFKLSRSDVYAPKANVKPVATNLEQYTFWTDTPYSKNLAVAVEKLPPGGLDENANYHMRKVYPDKYREELKSTNSQSVKVMVGLLDSDRVAFITHNDLVATIAVTSSNSDDNLDTEMSELLNSFSWK